ncbi:restriction endonuclease subunit S [Bacillus paranthracis]|uniref:restriction endonuclease subunit S n=1 Tax=Bacillus cereus group TaxID=86661 RepID=UPI0018CE5782|nr:MULTISPECIES: restriction endonuclease subunit S [Bacillus cereus group]HDX9599129.1 restriction endonuclease subunit S [Bacillus cereus]MBG9841279.1 restriction endonuclease subunit S [Bacillus tropicus]MBG9877456.1 restriction endonuclease subunit S [Bacillus tropicus]MBG9918967.1 restriction endonuclease subunit S [Bacillus tropicus]MBJ8350660.1 restriction endonuclease subunit S [Bacillus mycoides]
MKKKKNTTEELFEVASVPKEEQPYEVPGNWLWIRTESILNFVGGGTPSKSNPNYWDGEIPWATVKDIKGRYLYSTIDMISQEGVDNSSTSIAYPNELLLITRMSPGKSTITKIKTTINQDLKIVRPKIKISAYFLWLYFTINTPLIESMSTGSTVKGIQVNKLNKLPLPLPPLQEQKRIVEKVERLLGKIEEAKTLIEEAKETFELRRAAILDKAFSGDLTGKWRKENSFQQNEECISDNELRDSEVFYPIPKTWKWTKLKDVATFKNGYAFKSKDFVEQGIQLIRMGNLYKNELRLDRNPVYIPLDFDEKIIEKYTVEKGDILLSLTGTKYKRDYGYAVRVDGRDKNLLLNQRILSLKPHMMDEYIYYYLQSSVFRNAFFSFETGGVNQGNVGSKAVESILIPIPPADEAKEIEKKLARLLNNEKEALVVLAIEEKLEVLKQSALSKAFRGELGTNDPTEENTIELLKEVLKEKIK